jgi:hypothetical protein
MIDGIRRFAGRPVGVACVSGLIALVVVVGLGLASGRGLSGFVHAAPPFTDPAAAPSDLEVLPADESFDGQFYYRMAVAPFSMAERVQGVMFDTPVLRSARVGYPLLGFGVSLGNPDFVPFALVAVNVLAMFALGWFGAAFAREMGRHALWGLLLPLYPGFVYSLGFDLTEVVASACLVGALVTLRRGHTVAAIVLTTYALLTRETAAVLPLALVATWAWSLARRRIGVRDQWPQLLTGAIPLAVAAALQIGLRIQWGKFPIQDSRDTNIVVPLSGFVESFGKFFPPSSSGALFRDASIGVLLLVIVVAGVALRGSRTTSYEKTAYALAVIVAMLPNASIWEGATSFMRAATEAYLFAIIVMLGARIATDKLVAASVVAMFGLTVGSEVNKLR